MLVTHEREKLIDAIIYFVTNTKYCGVTKLFKLLFFLDFIHFRETGRSVTGLDYYVWPKGPAPRELWHEIKNERRDTSEVAFLSDIAVAEFDLSESKQQKPPAEALNVTDAISFESPDSDEEKQLTKIKPLVRFDGKHLSRREMRIMEELAFIFKDAKAADVSEITHLRGTPWKKTKDAKGFNSKIEYSLAMDGGKNQIDDEELTFRLREQEAIKKALK